MAPNPSQQTLLRDLIRRTGGILTVEAFMREALYNPEFGYYVKHIRTVGREGDFSTGATLHPAFGQAIAEWLIREKRRMGGAFTRWHVVELGGGDGRLLEAVLKALPAWRRRMLQCHIVEISPVLRARQEKRLRKYRRRIAWHEDAGAALEAAEGRALVYSVEFADAFPCVVLEKRGAEWREVALRADADGVVKETLLPAKKDAFKPGTSSSLGGRSGVPPLALDTFAPGAFSSLAPLADAPDGQRVELHRAYHRWLEAAVPALKAGAVLTIDYGETAQSLYHRRPRGTLRAYFHHQRLEGDEVYARIGRQDLTADVNFTDLKNWGESLGLDTAFLVSQREFMLDHVPRAEARANSDPALRYLLEPEGAGGAFKVLAQRRVE